MNVADFLYDAASDRRPWNCSTFPFDWCAALGHPDYAADWRGVTDPVACDAATVNGLLPLWDAGLGDALQVAARPYHAGDIAVVRRAGMEAGAIFDGERWALRTARGVVFVPLPDEAILKAWRPCPRR